MLDITRRSLLWSAAAGAGLATATPAAAAASGLVPAAELGIRPDPARDQSRALQEAIDTVSAAGGGLFLPPGVYVAGGLVIERPFHLAGLAGLTRLVQAGREPVVAVRHTRDVVLDGLTVDGQRRPLAGERPALVAADTVRDLTLLDCLLANAAGTAAVLTGCSGSVRHNRFADCAVAALFCLDSRGLEIAHNRVARMGDNGIQVWQSQRRTDGTVVTGNRIEAIGAASGGEGQYGNGISVFRAGEVVVANNRIDGCVYSAVRSNSGSNVQILGNSCSASGEVALYAEFAFEGAIIASNLVDGAATGVSITNFDHGGRLAVCSGNLIRNLVLHHSSDQRGNGISVEADTVVTGNVVEGAPTAGLWLGWGRGFRNISATGNVLRDCGVGITCSLADGARDGLIANNIISGARTAAIVGMNHHLPVTGDLALPGATVPAQLTITGNAVS